MKILLIPVGPASDTEWWRDPPVVALRFVGLSALLRFLETEPRDENTTEARKNEGKKETDDKWTDPFM